MNDVTNWAYTFWWKGAFCEARDGLIFVNGRKVEELSLVNVSHQTEHHFFVESQDVTDIIQRYLNNSAITTAEIPVFSTENFNDSLLNTGAESKNIAEIMDSALTTEKSTSLKKISDLTKDEAKKHSQLLKAKQETKTKAVSLARPISAQRAKTSANTASGQKKDFKD